MSDNLQACKVISLRAPSAPHREKSCNLLILLGMVIVSALWCFADGFGFGSILKSTLEYQLKA